MGNPWRDHIQETMKKNPKMKFKDVLKMAGKTYKKRSTSYKPSKPTKRVKPTKVMKATKSKKLEKKTRKSKRKETAWSKHIKETMKKNPKMKFKDVLKLAGKTYKK